MAIDNMSWHWDDTEKLYRKTHEIEGDLSDQQQVEIALMASNHIGLFLQWVFEKGFEGEDTHAEDVERVRTGELLGVFYFLQHCDGKLWHSDISEELHPFVQSYYEETDDYLKDYCNACLSDDAPLYGVISGRESYERLKEKMDAAYSRFLEKE